MYKRKMSYGIVAVAAIFLVFIINGFSKAMSFTIGPEKTTGTIVTQDASYPKDGERTAINSNTVRVLIIGDSIARGTGDENSKGIGGYLTDLLKNQTPKDIVVDNAGIDGYKAADLLAQVNSGKLDNSIAASNYIVISIGGNDLREIQSLQDVEKEQAFRDKQNSYTAALKEIIEKVRVLNKNTLMIMLGLYNPSVVNNESDNIKYLGAWNYNTEVVIGNDEKTVFVPTYDMFRFNVNRFVAGDNLHPNSSGYQTIAYLISKSVENTLNER